MAAVTGRAAYLELAEDIRQKIRSGELSPGDQLPSMSKLMEEHGVSNTVVRNAMHLLKSEGLVQGRQGKAVTVTEVTPTSKEPDIEAVMRRLDELGSAVEQLGERIAVLEASRSTSAKRQPAQER
ncbi:winged helix-turn-helix domain-containing protein [Streptomyces sp. NBC_00879]|uniref:winged helix-turn-helix domain-containing protein n=1 Tax=Streptomyces sp. NBC_00879 TaxID=2975855 RepID=UPI00386329F4|nr:winged helix-turn-helix domain-containing protein [Streptomyces sp. NBC_00879]